MGSVEVVLKCFPVSVESKKQIESTELECFKGKVMERGLIMFAGFQNKIIFMQS